MSREIKFRGKFSRTGEWIFGSLLKPWDGTKYLTIIHDGLYEHKVDPETVGQYTGLKDIDGTEVYENDVLEHAKTKVRYKVAWDEEILGYVLVGEAVTLTMSQYRLNALRVVKEW